VAYIAGAHGWPWRSIISISTAFCMKVWVMTSKRMRFGETQKIHPHLG
jgi:hypothetical protein